MDLSLVNPHRHVNWRKISDANVDSMARRGDIHSILSFADDVAYGDPGDLNVHPTLTSSLKLSQLTVQYLLHTQQALTQSGNQADERRAAARARVQKAKSDLKLQKDNLRALKHEHSRQEELIKSYRSLLHTLNPKDARRADHQTGRKTKPPRRSHRRGEEQHTDAQEENKEDLETKATHYASENNEEEKEEVVEEEEEELVEEEDVEEELVEEDSSGRAVVMSSETKSGMLMGVPEVRSSIEVDDMEQLVDPVVSLRALRGEEEEENRWRKEEKEAREVENSHKESHEELNGKSNEEDVRMARVAEEKAIRERRRQEEEEEARVAEEKKRELELERQRARLFEENERREREDREREEREERERERKISERKERERKERERKERVVFVPIIFVLILLCHVLVIRPCISFVRHASIQMQPLQIHVLLLPSYVL